MAQTHRRKTNEMFHRDLARIRSRIERVPEQYREMLKAAADEAEAQQERIWSSRARIEDMLADLGLIVEHTQFHVAACQRELRHLDPEGRFSL